ncbi:hypothetical protein B0T16DRAFT_332998 [Cercophora newfieldiana]|uniref:NADH-cytochrome b5 reductase n=1 Tax=Cercophora newfieldiana TaxID=92897 RepID=A0AA40CMI5_9PEZI|nr:hypothetical protein B0T16DRAFT_332998 [Cercophora newfieldiana]
MSFQIIGAGLAGAVAFAYYKVAYASEGPQGKPIFSSFGPKSLKVHSTELINHNTKKIRFELPDKSQTSGLGLCSSLLTISFPGGGVLPCPRPYTPTNDLDEKGYLELMVKHYPGGKGSTALHALKPGDRLTCLPIPAFKWAPNKFSHVAMIAGGAGITPMWQLAQGILKNPDDHARISLVWGVNTDSDIFLKDQFDALEKKYPNRFKVTYVVADKDSKSPYEKGFVTAELLEKLGLRHGPPRNNGTHVLVCGPPPMDKALTGGKGGSGLLSKLGYKDTDITALR